MSALLSPPEFLARLGAIVGDAHVITDGHDMAAYLTEPRGLWQGRALAVVRPGATAEVAAVARLCDGCGRSIVAQGGNTGLVGGQTPDRSGEQIVLSLARLARIRDLDASANAMTVEAGVTLHRVRAEAERADRLFPLSLASEGTCTLGGNLATNAGGSSVLAYGTARDLVLGLEVVLADGRVLNGLSKLRKDNTGYDLRHLFIGSEGTLGLITAADIKLFPRPRDVQTALVGLDTPRHCLELLTLAQSISGGHLKAFEFVPRIGLEFVAKSWPGAREPLPDRHNWYVLLELASQTEMVLPEILLRLLERAAEAGVIENAVVAASLAQRDTFWQWRERLADAQAPQGGSIKHDVAVPVALVPRFIAAATEVVQTTIPGARPVPFGHFGDGSIHFNVSQPVGADRDEFLARWTELNAKVHAIVAECHGSISAEHGIGVLKRDLLPSIKDPVALEVMRTLKRSLDPNGTLNPGKVL
jgi:FAD/FMN-containing dehydrogenase